MGEKKYTQQSTVYAEEGNGRTIALVYDCKEHEANAHLIAAAPAVTGEKESRTP